jgi:hypothetical protein
VVGPSEGTTRCESKFEETYFEGIPKARDMKSLKTLVLKAYLKQGIKNAVMQAFLKREI